MPSRAPTPPPASPRHALHGLVCLLLLAWADKAAAARSRTWVDNGPPPYLRVIGSLPLRFQPAPLPREAIARPAAGGPPLPVLTAATTPSTPVTETEPAPAQPSAESSPDPAPATPPASTPPPIIPDETRPRVQPEDFLPFFQFPGSTGASADGQVIVPIPATSNPPHHGTPSTATYRQR